VSAIVVEKMVETVGGDRKLREGAQGAVGENVKD